MLSLSKTFALLGKVLSNNNREHRVGDGDSLAWLAEKYGTTVKALKELNNMKDDTIYSGRFVLRHLISALRYGRGCLVANDPFSNRSCCDSQCHFTCCHSSAVI